MTPFFFIQPHRIYTYVSNILIAVNPYFVIPGLYDIDLKSLKEYESGKDPHVYAIAKFAHSGMMDAASSKRCQSVIVSGESGAGKTEACKKVIKYLAALSQRQISLVSSGGTGGKGLRRQSSVGASTTITIEEKVMQCNPFLEAFGNAKTRMNDNSSRFGKFLQIQYNRGRIVGARMDQYLLEKARLVHQGSLERNYHVSEQYVC